MHCVLGIDTSNYTTSLAVVDADTGALLAEKRMLLPVKPGEKGLRQSDALFFHVQQIPLVMGELIRELKQRALVETPTWVGVGVSVRPRPSARSYMPVFHLGESFAYTFAAAVRQQVVRTSHQEGHLAAADYFLEDVHNEPFLAVHLSGGTSDVMWAKRTRFGYEIDLFGEGSDLHAGQFVDRIGVALGLSFPAGPHLELLARTAVDSEFRLAARVQAASMSFSGPCSAALRAVAAGVPAAEIARAVEACIASNVVKALMYGYERRKVSRCVIAGGVASNAWIRNRIVHRLNILAPSLSVYFAPSRFSSDNALGVAKIARDYLYLGESLVVR